MAFVLLLVGGWLSWRRAAAPVLRAGACRGCNLLLITIDTLRVDRVGAFGGRPGLTPNLDRLAADGVRFTRAYASAPLTLPSHTSIMTAVPPPVHGVRNNSLFRLGDTLPTLATVLQAAGYRTGAFVGAFVLDARFGLNRGFDVYDDRYGEKASDDPAEGAERRAEDVIRPATSWIVNPQSTIRNPQWFAWVHLYDPHEPYRAPEPYASQHEPYDAEVAYADAMVGQLLADLRVAGQLDHTLIVVAADHGESLGEHGERTHGVFVYDATMRVPLILSGSGFRVQGSVASRDDLVRLIDLAPTALDLLGLASPPSFQGSTVRFDADPTGRVAYLEAMDANLTRNWAPLTALATLHDKVIDLPIPELYDLDADPHEAVNLFARQPERARTLDALLRGVSAGFAATAAGAAKATLDADARQRLQALGYVTSTAAPGARTFTDEDDPKHMIGPAEDLNRALAAFTAGSRQAGMAAAAAIVRAHPRFTTAAGIYASMQRATGDLPGAVATLEGLVRRDLADQSVLLVLASYLQEAGALDRSAALLRAIIAAHPDYAEAYNSLGVVLSRQGHHAEARDAYRRVLALDPTSAKAYENLGADEFAAGELDAAAADLTRALTLDPRLAGAYNALAAVAMRQGRRAEAIAAWRKTLQIDPRSFDALYNLGIALHDSGQVTEARPLLQRFVEQAPPGRYAADIAQLKRLLAR